MRIANDWSFAEQPERSLRAVARDHCVDPGGLSRALRAIPGAAALREARKPKSPRAVKRESSLNATDRSGTSRATPT